MFLKVGFLPLLFILMSDATVTVLAAIIRGRQCEAARPSTRCPQATAAVAAAVTTRPDRASGTSRPASLTGTSNKAAPVRRPPSGMEDRRRLREWQLPSAALWTSAPHYWLPVCLDQAGLNSTLPVRDDLILLPNIGNNSTEWVV